MGPALSKKIRMLLSWQNQASSHRGSIKIKDWQLWWYSTGWQTTRLFPLYHAWSQEWGTVTSLNVTSRVQCYPKQPFMAHAGTVPANLWGSMPRIRIHTNQYPPRMTTEAKLSSHIHNSCNLAFHLSNDVTATWRRKFHSILPSKKLYAPLSNFACCIYRTTRM